MPHRFRLASPDDSAQIEIDPAHGGRLSSFAVDGRELLVTETDDPLTWGCYPMVPFAGRIRAGLLEFDGVAHSLPAPYNGHAMHGNGFTSAWEQLDATTIGWDFAAPWPFAGSVRQHFDLRDDSLTMTMTIAAAERQPAHMGWHPWFSRDINTGSALELDFVADSMYLRDSEGLPSGELVEPPRGPWDDCFTGLVGQPVLRWGAFELRLSSSADHWVVFNEPEHAMCVEPQTGPPNMSNDAPQILDAGETTSVSFTLEW